MTSANRQVARYIPIDREQLRWDEFSVEDLIDLHHPARLIWALSARFDLWAFDHASKSLPGEAGRPGWEPRLLVSVWLYG